MKVFNVDVSSKALTSAGLALVVGLAAMGHQELLGAVAIAVVEVGRWWRMGDLTLERLQADCWLWLGGLSSLVIIALNPVVATQIILTMLYGAYRWWLLARRSAESVDMRAAAVAQILGLWAIFLATAVWRVPTIVVLILVWGTSWLIAKRALAGSNDRAAEALALTWALIVAECSWVFSLWLVSYIVLGVVIIPQPALVLTALGYCLSGIYVSHRRSQLSRARLVEYLMIGLLILVFVIFGTKWNGVI